MRVRVVIAIAIVAATSNRNTVRAAAQTSTTHERAGGSVLSVVKPSRAGISPGALQVPIGGRFVAEGVTVRALIAASYGGYIPLRSDQMTGGPKWIDSERYDVEARAETASADDSPFRELKGDDDFTGAFAMVRTLLAERFRLVVHEKTTEGRVYALITSRRDRAFAPQIHNSTIDCEKIAANGPFAPPLTGRDGTPLRPCGVRAMSGQIIGSGGTMAQLAQRLAMVSAIERDVVDRTGLTARYDFTLNWTPTTPSRQQESESAPAADAGPSLFAALQEQLGLKLEPQRGAVRVLVIDRVERPTPN